MIDIVFIDEILPDSSCYKFNDPKFGYTLNLANFVRYHFEHRLVKKPDYQNETYVFIAICNPDNITTIENTDNPNVLHVNALLGRIPDNEKLNIVVCYPMETFIAQPIIPFMDKLLSSYTKAKFFFSQGNANSEHLFLKRLYDRVTYLSNPLFEALYGDYLRDSNLSTVEKKPLNKKFLVPIRHVKPFRLAFYMWMKDNSILDSSYYSWTTENLYNVPIDDISSQFLLNRKLSPEDIDFLKKPIFLDKTDENQILKTQWNMSDTIVESSFMQIVLETTFTESLEKDSPTIFLTEKTYKPIFYKQPFILVSEPYSLRYLHSLGYKTFGSFIDESYDEITDPHQRMKHITNEVLKINSMSLEELEDIRDKIQDIVEHNYNVFMSRPSEKILVKHIEETLLYGKQRSIKLIRE